jgi:hypothetical protein
MFGAVTNGISITFSSAQLHVCLLSGSFLSRGPLAHKPLTCWLVSSTDLCKSDLHCWLWTRIKIYTFSLSAVVLVVLSSLLFAFVVLVSLGPHHTSSPLLTPSLASPIFDCANISEITIDTIQRLFRNGALSSRALVTCYLRRIEDYDNMQTFKGYVSGPFFSFFSFLSFPSLVI